MPRPNVGSAVIRLTRHKEKPVDVKSPEFMFALIRASFNQRRKTLVNGLLHGGLGLTKEQVLAALEEMGEKETVRGETFTLEKFATLSNILKQ